MSSESNIDLYKTIKQLESKLKEYDEQGALLKEIGLVDQFRDQKKFIFEIFEAISHPLYVINLKDFSIEIANSAAKKTLKVKEFEVTKNELFNLIGDSRKFFVEMNNVHSIGKRKNIQKPISKEYSYLGADGKYCNIEVHTHPIINTDGIITKLIESIIDISERKRLEEENNKERKRKNYKHQISSIGEMASGMAHEINNPLTVIKGTAQIVKRMLNRDPLNIEKIELKVDRIISNVERIAELIKGLTYVGDNEFFVEKSFFKDENIISIIDQSLRVCSNGFRKYDIDFKYKYVDKEIYIECLPALLNQALFNLVKNSIDAIKDLTEKWIKVKVYNQANQVKILVIDSGNGISSEIREKIMIPFFTTKFEEDGSGLGLVVAKGIIERHGGTLELNHSLNNTCFEIILPKVRHFAKVDSL